MLERMVHRGPDDQGTFLHGTASIGMRRLSIIDLETGHQPIGNEDGTIQCVLNGEIYNYVELRRDLEARGHTLRTRSDTEAIVHLYEEEGAGFLHHLRGMFAIALLDRRKEELLLARDRLGIKPLVYAEPPGGGLVFASEIDALLASDLLAREPDPVALEQLLSLGYAVAPRTAFRAIRRLPPAHLLRVHRGGTELRRYWSAPRVAPVSISAGEAAERFLSRLRESVRLRLRSDVPVGAFLSGGLDSSLLVAVAAGESGEPLRTFTIGFPGSPQDESRWALRVAERYGTRHRNLIVDRTDAAAVLEDLVARHGEPFGDPSAIPTWYLCKMAAGEVRVALGGDGGDELLAGYTRYQGERFARWWGRIPRPLSALVRSLAPAEGRVARVLRASERDAIGRYLCKSRFLPPSYWEGLYHPAWREGRSAAPGSGTERGAVGGEARAATSLRAEAAEAAREAEAEIAAILEAAREMDWVGQMGACDLGFYLPNDMLFKVDAASMAHSLEVRLPYLDHLLVEECARLPGRLKLRGWTRKWLMRRVARAFLPADLIARRKQGFIPPLERWFASGLRRTARDRLLAPGGAGGRILDAGALSAWLERDPPAQALWSALLLDAWTRRYL